MASATERLQGLAAIGALLLLLGCPLGADPDWDGRLALRWNLLTRRNSVRSDYQDLRGQARLTSPAMGRRAVRLHLEVSARQGLDERFFGEDNPYANRLQVRRAFAEARQVAGGELHLGRHQPQLRGIGPWEVDGVTWRRQGRVWSVGLTGGFQVPFWEADAPPDRGAAQWGGEARWHLPGQPWEAGIAALRDANAEGTGRWRLGLDGSWRAGRQLSGLARAELDPRNRRWLLWRLSGTCRPGAALSAGLSYAYRRPTAFPVAGEEDTLAYGERVRDLGGWVSGRWGRSLSGLLRLRSTWGGRQFRSEQAQVRWRDLPLSGWGLALSLSDSWSPWRRLEQATLEMQGRRGRRWYFAAGATGSLFEWDTSRAPAWRVRLRPRLSLRFTPAGPLVWETRVEEELDEFQNLRTRATAGMAWQW
jgi:hypothetical protein